MNTSRRGYPIGALFVLMTVCAVLLAGISPLAQNFNSGTVSFEAFLGALGIGALAGMLLGMVLGLFQFQMARGVATGAVAGCVIGLIAGGFALLSSDQIATAAIAM